MLGNLSEGQKGAPVVLRNDSGAVTIKFALIQLEILEEEKNSKITLSNLLVSQMKKLRPRKANYS